MGPTADIYGHLVDSSHDRIRLAFAANSPAMPDTVDQRIVAVKGRYVFSGVACLLRVFKLRQRKKCKVLKNNDAPVAQSDRAPDS